MLEGNDEKQGFLEILLVELKAIARYSVREFDMK